MAGNRFVREPFEMLAHDTEVLERVLPQGLWIVAS